MNLVEYPALFLISLAGSFHCIGMCGGIAAMHAASIAHSGGKSFIDLFLYQLGRIWSYLFVGALFGALGSFLLAVERLLALLAGLFMIWVALSGFRILKGKQVGVLEKSLISIFAWLKGRRGLSASLYFGLFNGLLPCSLVYAFAAKAASTGSVVAGILTMASFGLGTIPAMLFSARMAQLFSPAIRHRFVFAATLSILILGVVTLLRGLLPFPIHPVHWVRS